MRTQRTARGSIDALMAWNVSELSVKLIKRLLEDYFRWFSLWRRHDLVEWGASLWSLSQSTEQGVVVVLMKCLEIFQVVKALKESKKHKNYSKNFFLLSSHTHTHSLIAWFVSECSSHSSEFFSFFIPSSAFAIKLEFFLLNSSFRSHCDFHLYLIKSFSNYSSLFCHWTVMLQQFEGKVLSH